MRSVKATVTLAIAVLALAASGSAFAFGYGYGGYSGYGRHGSGHVRFGVFVGAPLYYPGYYPGYYPYSYYYPAPSYYYPPAYYPPAVVVQSSPPVYIEQSTSQPAPAQTNYWYYCAESRTYYPYVKECPGGWQRVAPQPAQ